MSTTVPMMLIVLFIAFLVETLTEYVFGTIFDKFPALSPYKWVLMYIPVAIGILGAYIYQLDLVYLFSQTLKTVDPNIGFGKTDFGLIITGISIGRGSNYIHQIMSKFFPVKA